MGGAGPETRRKYGYDAQGNRLWEWLNFSGGGGISTIGEGSLATRTAPIDPSTAPPSLTELSNNRGYHTNKFDEDGRQLWRKAANDSTNAPNSIINYGFPSGSSLGHKMSDRTICALGSSITTQRETLGTRFLVYLG